MPSSKNKNSKKKLLKGGKSCPTGSHKVCITTGQLDKLLKQVAVKKRTKTRKLKKTKSLKSVETKSSSFMGSIFGSNEVAPKKPTKAEKEPKIAEAPIPEPIVESPITEPMADKSSPIAEPMTNKSSTTEETSTSNVEKPKKETSFLGSIFGSNAEPATPVAK
jgi:hypothetical protein